jgi:hypothetical protein
MIAITMWLTIVRQGRFTLKTRDLHLCLLVGWGIPLLTAILPFTLTSEPMADAGPVCWFKEVSSSDLDRRRAMFVGTRMMEGLVVMILVMMDRSSHRPSRGWPCTR